MLVTSGKPERILAHVISELKCPKKRAKYISVVYEHHKILTGHTHDYDGTNVLDLADSHPKLKVKKILHIDKRRQIQTPESFRKLNFDTEVMTALGLCLISVQSNYFYF